MWLPVVRSRAGAHNYRQHRPGEKLVERKLVKDYVVYHTDRKVRYHRRLVSCPKAPVSDTVIMVSSIGRSVPTHELPPVLFKTLNLIKSFSTTNMHLFNQKTPAVSACVSSSSVFRPCFCS